MYTHIPTTPEELDRHIRLLTLNNIEIFEELRNKTMTLVEFQDWIHHQETKNYAKGYNDGYNAGEEDVLYRRE